MTGGKWPILDPRDKRLNVPENLSGKGEPARVCAVFTDLKPTPDDNAGLATQALYGEALEVFETRSDWSLVQCEKDNYVGWTLTENIGPRGEEPTHRVCAPRTFLYPEPDMKKPRTGYRSMGSLVTVTGEEETRGTWYAILSDGSAVIRRHIAPLNRNEPDYVSVAETLLHAPYLWGGNSGFGLDCSGLVQLAFGMAGKSVLRDSDMQAATIGKPVNVSKDWMDLQRGDLVFWKGHVAIATGNIDGIPHLLHANGYTMDVTSEPAKQAIDRIAYLYELPIGVRRP